MGPSTRSSTAAVDGSAPRRFPAFAAGLGILALLGAAVACRGGTREAACGADPARASVQPSAARADPEEATSSRRCAVCHPAIYAEHVQNTHGGAFRDEEARLATRGFRRENCIRCHTPRPVAETGQGMVPIERRHDLEEGNTCMSCHAKAGYDYAGFHGGPECKVAFDDRVGTVEACATCHRIAGTPEQWEHAKNGKLAGTLCVACHMPLVERPVAVGEAPRLVHTHRFPASRSEEQLRRAYTYDARIEGDEVVVTVVNSGAGHNFPTATIQRAVESLVVVRDAQGKEVANDRAFFGHPYLKPEGLELPTPTQIPSGGRREHRVRLPAGSGTVECSLFFKTYHPVEDEHPTMSRRLEWRRLAFEGVTPVEHPAPPPAPPSGLPAVSPADAARPDGLAKFAHVAPGVREVPIPTGDTDDDLARWMAILEFPVPGARAEARKRLVSLGARAVPSLVEGLGHWSDETRDQSVASLVEIGEPAVPALEAALTDGRLYVRYHARVALSRMPLTPDERTRVRRDLVAALSAPHPLDRRSALDALATLADPATASAVRPLLADPDCDVVAAAANVSARIGDAEAVAPMERALRSRPWVETRRDLALALARLGSRAGIPWLLENLDQPDEVTRASIFDAFFRATGLHASYDPYAPRPERLEALARLQSAWAASGGADLRPVAPDDPAERERAWGMVEALGGGTDTLPGGDDTTTLEGLVGMGPAAVPALIEGLAFPPGYFRKRGLACEALGRIGDRRAAPYLVQALRDPYLSVAGWACRALATCGDEQAVPALRAWSRRLSAVASAPRAAGTQTSVDALLARAAWTRTRLEDDFAAAELASLGADPAVASGAPPSFAERMIATTEAAPVAAPTSPADAVAKAQVLRAQDFYEDAVRVLVDSDAHFGPTAAVRLETAWNLLMIGEEDVTRNAAKSKIDAEVAVARKAFEEAVRMDAHVPGQDLLQAKLLRYEGSNVLAGTLLKSLARREPDDPNVRREYADFAYLGQDWLTAEREYLAAYRLRPKDAWALLYATMSSQWLERPARDLEEGYLAAAKRLPEEPQAIDRLAGLYADDPAKDVALLDRLIAARPDAVLARTARARLVLGLEGATSPSGALARRLEALSGLDPEKAKDVAAEIEIVLSDTPPGGLEPEARLRGWEALVARFPTTGARAHRAGVWYLDVAKEPATAARFLERAVSAEPSSAAYRRDLERAKSSNPPPK